jgi:hypothetical protein
VTKNSAKRWVIGLSAAAILSACADAPPEKVANTNPRRHESPLSIPAPILPEGSFDRDRGQAALIAARANRQAGQLPEARQQAEASINAWPADPDAWQTLADICLAIGDQTCRHQADFFRAKVDYANTLPTRAAVLGFQTIAEEPVGATGTGITYDRKSLDAATRLWAFYDAQDTRKNSRDAPLEPSFSEEYPYVPMAIIGGTIAGALTIIKSVANSGGSSN